MEQLWLIMKHASGPYSFKDQFYKSTSSLGKLLDK